MGKSPFGSVYGGYDIRGGGREERSIQMVAEAT